MFTAQQYRAKANECEGLLRDARSSGEASELRELVQSYLALAENADWLTANRDKTIQPGESNATTMPAESAQRTALGASHDE